MSEKLLHPNRIINRLSSLSFLCLIILLSQDATAEYQRPPPRGLVVTHHLRSDSDPQQVHISLAGKDHITVSWLTDDDDVPSLVEYGTRSKKYHASATGYNTSYNFLIYNSGTIHYVKIGPLRPKTTYYYRCGGHGQEFSFVTPPATYPIEFAVVGDLGQTEWTKSTLAQISKKDYDVFLLPGDLPYADGLQQLWDSFGRLVEPYASARPWMVTEGNHEIESVPIIYPFSFKAYNARWRMPFEESGSPSNLYYSFDVVGTHVIMLGSYADFDADSDQYKWLEADLGKVDRKVTPWLIVLIHAPWYNTNAAHKGDGESMRIALEEMLYKAKVDIVFAGHVHAYERFTRVYNNQADPCGPIYVTIGDGGNREGLAEKFEKLREPILSVFREPSFGHGRLRILNETHAHWSWHRNDDEFSTIADQVFIETLSKSQKCMTLVQDGTQKDEL
ncbi:unnamed protein product [Rhodiola kirilowii]